jgi:hypothetical protein
MKRTLISILLLPLAAIAADTNALPSLLPAYPEMSPTFWEQYRVLVLVGGLACLVILSLGLWFLFKPKPPVVVSPAVVAREALKKLQQQPVDGVLLSEVSQILKRYVGAVLSFPASEMTTAEFLTTVAREEIIGSELASVIANFLHECDLRKFSPADSATSFSAVSHALELVSKIHDQTGMLNLGRTMP